MSILAIFICWTDTGSATLMKIAWIRCFSIMLIQNSKALQTTYNLSHKKERHIRSPLLLRPFILFDQILPKRNFLVAKPCLIAFMQLTEIRLCHLSDIKTVKPAYSFCQSIKIRRFCPFASVWLQKMFIQTIIHYHYCFHSKSLYKLKPSTELIFSIGIPVA